jgi:cell division transport system ATP-binding protein
VARDLVLKAFPGAAPVEFSVAPGDHWLVVGEANSGKTSLAKSLLGIISLKQGSVALFGQSLDALKPDELLSWRRRVAAIFSGDGLMPAWTGLDNLALPLRLGGARHGDTIERQVRDWTAGYRIPSAWLDAISGTLSRDARLTLALARALIKQPGLLIMDGFPIDNALAYRRDRGREMLGDFVRAGGTLLVLVREAYADRYAEAVSPLRFRRARLENGQLHLDGEIPSDTWARATAAPVLQPPGPA